MPRKILQTLGRLESRARHAAFLSGARTEAPRAPGRRDPRRGVPVSCGDRPWGGPGPRARARGGEILSHSARHGREERLLLPHAHGEGTPAGPARGLRRSEEGVVQHHGQRHPPLRGPRGRGPELEGPVAHLQHRLPRLPRESALHELRREERLIQHHLERAGHQLRDMPRPLRRARSGLPRAARRKDAQGLAGPHDQAWTRLHGPPGQLGVRPVPRQDGPPHIHLSAGGAVLRPLRPHDPGESGLPSGRARSRRKLHIHTLADEPVREGRAPRLPPLPHPERTVPVRRR